MTCHVEIVGQGKPLVLIHGWGMHSGVWQPLVKRLAKDYMLYMVDLPGMGHSRPIEPYHLYNLADEVAEVIPGVCDVLGWSLGGLVAQSIAATQPDRIRRLVLVGTTPCFVRKDDWQTAIEPEYWREFADDVNKDYKHTMLQFLTLMCMRAQDARATIKELRKSFDLKPAPTHATLQRALHIMLESDLRADAQTIRRPTLLIHGDRDTLVPVQAAHWMMQALPLGFLRVISGAAHAPFLSHSDAFIATLNQFLEPAA